MKTHLTPDGALVLIPVMAFFSSFLYHLINESPNEFPNKKGCLAAQLLILVRFALRFTGVYQIFYIKRSRLAHKVGKSSICGWGGCVINDLTGLIKRFQFRRFTNLGRWDFGIPLYFVTNHQQKAVTWLQLIFLCWHPSWCIFFNLPFYQQITHF